MAQRPPHRLIQSYVNPNAVRSIRGLCPEVYPLAEAGDLGRRRQYRTQLLLTTTAIRGALAIFLLRDEPGFLPCS